MSCYACYCNQVPPPITSDAYLSALSDVNLRGLAATEAGLCEEHKQALARHVSAQAEVMARFAASQKKPR